MATPVPLDQIVNVGSTITIEELEATSPGGKPRRVVLVGGGLPLRGQASWSSESKVVTTWYVGNGTEASQQNLGSMEMPSQFAGEWNRTRMGRAPSAYTDERGVTSGVIDPMALYQIIDSIRAEGAKIRFTWSVRGRQFLGSTTNGGQDREVDFTLVREGKIKQVGITPDRHTDVKWTMTCEWSGRGKRSAKVVDTRSDDDLALATGAVQASLDALELYVDDKVVSINKDVRKSASFLTLGQLERMAGAPKRLVDSAMNKLRYNVGQFQRAGSVVRTIGSSPFAMANSVLDFARNTSAVANKFVDEMGRTPPELLATRRKISDLARSQRYFGNITEGMTAAAREAASLDTKLRRTLVAGSNQAALTVRDGSTTRAGDLLSIHVCKAGDTPERVSSKYYGNPDQAEPLLRANRLPPHTPSFRQGLILVIPALVGAPRPQ